MAVAAKPEAIEFPIAVLHDAEVDEAHNAVAYELEAVEFPIAVE